MSLSESRKFEHHQGEKLDYWQKQYSKLGHNPNGHCREYQDFLHEAVKLKERNGMSLNTLELNLFKQKNEGWNFTKFRQLPKEAISSLSSEERVQYRDFLVSRIHSNKPLARAQANLVMAGYDLGTYGTHGVDGKLGPLTARAIKSFQESIGLKPTGELDQETSRALDLMTKLGMTKREIEGIGEKLGYQQDEEKIEVQISNPELHERYPHVEIPGGGRIKDLSEAKSENLLTIQGYDKEYQLDYRAVEAYNDMIEQARKDGINPPLLQIVSGYRGDDYQKRLYNQKFQEIKERNKTWSDEQVAKATRKWVAPPGGSPHRTGRAIDLYLGISNQSKNVELQRKTETFQWLQKNAHKYGFYNYENEPWHWEYNPPANISER